MLIFRGVLCWDGRNLAVFFREERLSVELSLEIWFGRDQSCCKYGWWFQIFFIFTRIPGEIIQFDDHIFQMTSWIDQYQHFLKLPMRLVLKILELARDLGVNSHPDSRKRNCHVFLPCGWRLVVFPWKPQPQDAKPGETHWIFKHPGETPPWCCGLFGATNLAKQLSS